MPSTQELHRSLRNLLAQNQWDDAQAFWLDLAEQLSDEPDFLLILIKEFVDAGQLKFAADLASLLASSLKSAGKNHEWLYALKLQIHATPTDKNLRTELAVAYQKIYENDTRLRAILAVAGLDQANAQLPLAIAKVDTLLALKTGHFCQHKSWGVGKVKSFDATLNRVVIAFPHNPDHAMQLTYAADSLVPISAEHIEVRKLTDLTGLKQLAGAEPVTLVRLVLISHHHAATADKIESSLSGSVIAAVDWKRWWESTKKLLKRDPHFEVPTKKIEPVILRTAPVAQQDELLEAFRNAPGLGQKTEVARQLLKIVDDIADPELFLQEFQDGLLVTLKKLKVDYAAARLDAAFIIDELRSHQKSPPDSITPLVTEILTGVRDLPGLLDDLTAASQKRAVAMLKATQPERLIKELNRLPGRVLDEIADSLDAQLERITTLVRNQTASPELLIWIYKNLDARTSLQSLQEPSLLLAILSAIEAGQPKATKRLRDFLFTEEELIPSLLANADTDTVRDVARHILGSPAFEELDRRSLMARIMKVFPFVQEFLVTKTVKEQPLIVSWASNHRRRAELEEIVQKKIPHNSKEIAQARSYGDLRENFEYKAAKDAQKLLMRRRAELEILLSRAQATDFADARTDSVGIGSTVTITDLTSGKSHTYHILGAWDSDPNRGIISYPAGLAQVMLNKKVGDIVEAIGESGSTRFRIDSIEKVPTKILQSL